MLIVDSYNIRNTANFYSIRLALWPRIHGPSYLLSGHVRKTKTPTRNPGFAFSKPETLVLTKSPGFTVGRLFETVGAARLKARRVMSVIDVKKRFLRFLFLSRFLRFLTFFIFRMFLKIKKR